MLLEEFVQSVLTDIVKGIRAAQADEMVGAYVVPMSTGSHDFPDHPRVSAKSRLTSTIVDFDIGVTVEESSTVSGSGGLKVIGIGGNVEGDSSSRDSRVSRIQFGVPIMLPKSEKAWNEADARG